MPASLRSAKRRKKGKTNSRIGADVEGQVDAESDRLVGISAGTRLVGVRTSKDRHGRLDPEDINISNPGEKLTEQTSLQDGETIVEVINAIQPNP